MSGGIGEVMLKLTKGRDADPKDVAHNSQQRSEGQQCCQAVNLMSGLKLNSKHSLDISAPKSLKLTAEEPPGFAYKCHFTRSNDHTVKTSSFPWSCLREISFTLLLLQQLHGNLMAKN
eukprot:773646-Pelagomonas_calceolata.AAC.2